jgi:hypothetical protein
MFGFGITSVHLFSFLVIQIFFHCLPDTYMSIVFFFMYSQCFIIAEVMCWQYLSHYCIMQKSDWLMGLKLQLQTLLCTVSTLDKLKLRLRNKT